MIGGRERAKENIAFRYWVKDKSRTDWENWILAEELLQKLEKRYKIGSKHAR